ncbi:MAG: phosphate-selective porin OprO and OprP [Gammaproteobacteria bacterium]|nr:MAG: phosphate-selective porin OprO and OprP [Gammaproteobacteria bacterium]TND07314.1 MAG: phosphate-selective porin OprO and OprP [Gammaproteobacteria bacterium]
MGIRNLKWASLASALLTFGVAAVANAEEINVSTTGGLKIETPDKQFMFSIGGLIQADADFYLDDKADLTSGTEFRRARFFLKGRLFGDWEFKFEPDLAEDTIEMQDLYLRYTGLDNGNVTIGHFRQPFSLDDMTSSRYLTFMERALPNVFAPAIRMGVGYDTSGTNSSIAFGLFGEPAGAGDGGDEGFGVGGRVTFSPTHEDARVIHVGASAGWRKPEDDTNKTMRYRQRPESHVTNTRLVDTGTINDVDDIAILGIEAAGAWGPLSLQGEIISSSVSASTDSTFSGAYVFASYFLTGESHPYSVSSGTFERIKPKSSKGAWEIAVRYSTLDLTDEAISGGEENNITLGVNYYVNPNVKFQANYIAVDTDAIAGDDDPSIVQARAQIDF